MLCDGVESKSRLSFRCPTATWGDIVCSTQSRGGKGEGCQRQSPEAEAEVEVEGEGEVADVEEAAHFESVGVLAGLWSSFTMSSSSSFPASLSGLSNSDLIERIRCSPHILLLDVPAGISVGVDLKCWQVGEKMRGFKLVPRGCHYIYHRSVSWSFILPQHSHAHILRSHSLAFKSVH